MVRIKHLETENIETKRGKPPLGKKPRKTELRKVYIKESKSIRKIAEVLGCSKDMVYRTIKEYGIERRPNIKESKLSKYSLKELRDIVFSKGYRKAARSLGVGYTTLRLYLRLYLKRRE
jgi:DNA invertase Pin-like site-specific DNA recombinase